MSARKVNVFAAALAAGTMAAGMMPAQVAHAKEQPVAVAPAQRRRRRRQQQAKKPTSRKDRIRELEKRESWGTLSVDAHAELRGLRHLERISRGPTARRMTRHRYSYAEKLCRIGGVVEGKGTHRRKALRVDRLTRTQRRGLMRELGFRASGRQWRKLRKAERRQAGVA